MFDATENIDKLDAIKGGQIFHFSYISTKDIAAKRGGGTLVTITENCRAHSKQSYAKACKAANPDYEPTPLSKKDGSPVYEHLGGHLYRHIDSGEIRIGIAVAKSKSNPVKVTYKHIKNDGQVVELTQLGRDNLLPDSQRSDYKSPKAIEIEQSRIRMNKDLVAQGRAPLKPIPTFKFYKPESIRINGA